ncbi:MAG TPA: acyltransferase [Vicinamibacterales bacterium]|nr:acyltransferase [Vicinamibacterales bacterium]
MVEKPDATPRDGGAAARAIPSLDGLRGVSILLVLFAHARGTLGTPAFLSSAAFDHGVLGVRVFFVISGFLITRLIVEEIDTTGRLSLKLFYIRRALRIFPAFYLFLGVVICASAVHWLAIPAGNFWFAATYTMNFVQHGYWETGHLWSLAVEEQFYLLWPFTICTLGLRRASILAALLAVAAPYALLALFLRGSGIYMIANTAFPLSLDAIAAGCVLGAYIGRLEAHAVFQRVIRSRYGAVAPVVVLALDFLDHHSALYHGVAQPAITAGICYSIARYTHAVQSPGARLLAARPLVWLGQRSYSLYLWQQLFLDPYQHSLLQAFPISLLGAFACAGASYRFIEVPLNRLRRRFRAARTARRGAAPRIAVALP